MYGSRQGHPPFRRGLAFIHPSTTATHTHTTERHTSQRHIPSTPLARTRGDLVHRRVRARRRRRRRIRLFLLPVFGALSLSLSYRASQRPARGWDVDVVGTSSSGLDTGARGARVLGRPPCCRRPAVLPSMDVSMYLTLFSNSRGSQSHRQPLRSPSCRGLPQSSRRGPVPPRVGATAG